jgi:hypothetical protein
MPGAAPPTAATPETAPPPPAARELTPPEAPATASTPASPAAAPGPCGPLDPAPAESVLWAAVPAADRASLEGKPRRVVMAELDGAPPTEAALLVQDVPPSDTYDQEGQSVLWVLAKRGAGWIVTGRREYFITEGPGGTFDGEPGNQVLRPEELRATCGQFLRVEHLDLRGSSDPRYSIRRFELLHVVEGALVPAFTCVTNEDNAEGPDRSGTTTTRTVVYQRGTPLSIRVREVTLDERERRQVAQTTYVLTGPRFQAPNDLCRSGR